MGPEGWTLRNVRLCGAHQRGDTANSGGQKEQRQPVSAMAGSRKRIWVYSTQASPAHSPPAPAGVEISLLIITTTSA